MTQRVNRGIGLIMLTVLALAAQASCARASAEGDRPPNLIVIMADDLGAKELGCYGNLEYRTPNIDLLARTGIQFRTAYATPICHPTRFLIMTGQYGCHNGVYQFAGRPGGPKPTDPEENIANHYTFARLLKDRGYRTAMAGKWQLTGKIPSLVREVGFDEYCMWAYKHNLPEGVKHTGGFEGGSKTSRYWHPSIVRNSKYVPTKLDDYGPNIFTDFVLEFAKKNADRPFFIYYPMALTHGPFYTTPDTTWSAEDKFVNRRTNFGSNVEYMDKLVGRIVEGIDDLGLRDRTVIFFTADNGTGGDGKGRPTELGARVPFIVNCPALVKATGPTDVLTDLSDVFPTLAALSGAKIPEGRVTDGKSFAWLLRGEEADEREWIFSYIADRRILRTRRWLLEDNSPQQFGRLYDCADSRDGTGYREVTDSRDPEVVAVRRRFRSILEDLPAPRVTTTELPESRRERRAGRREATRREEQRES